MKPSDSGAGLDPGSGPSLSQSPSFTGYSSGTMAEIAARVVSEFAHDDDDYYDDVLYQSDVSPQPEYNDLLHRNDVGLEETRPGIVNEEEEEDDDRDFEFEFSVPAGEDKSSPISADEIFYNGQIRPLFPVFNTDLVFADTDWRSNFQSDGENQLISSQPPKPSTSAQDENSNSNLKPEQTIPIRLPLKKLLLSERETSVAASASCSSSEADELEGVTPGTYCVWTPPKQEMSKKSKSTGSSKRWKFRNLVHRSHSDGRDNFVFLSPKQQQQQQNERAPAKEKPAVPSPAAVERSGSGGGRRKEETTTSSMARTAAVGKAHREHYLKNRAMRENDRKKSYLPYKQDLVGLFANVNGLSRTIQPF